MSNPQLPGQARSGKAPAGDTDDPNPEAHGVHGTAREDRGMQEEPVGTHVADEEAWAEATETGAEAT